MFQLSNTVILHYLVQEDLSLALSFAKVLNSSWVTWAAVPLSDTCRNNEGGRAVPRCMPKTWWWNASQPNHVSWQMSPLHKQKSVSSTFYHQSDGKAQVGIDPLLYRAERQEERLFSFVSQSEHNDSCCVHRELFSPAGIFVLLFSFENIAVS